MQKIDEAELRETLEVSWACFGIGLGYVSTGVPLSLSLCVVLQRTEAELARQKRANERLQRHLKVSRALSWSVT